MSLTRHYHDPEEYAVWRREHNTRIGRDPINKARRRVGQVFAAKYPGVKTRIPDESLYKALARKEFWFFVEYVHGGLYKHAAHTRLICSYLKLVESGEIDRLILALPPRHGKSMTVTESFPAWYLLRNPDRRVIEVSYSDEFAQRFGRANRRKVADFGPELFGYGVQLGNASVTNWSVADHRGGLISSGVGGSITGEGADLLVIDDPIKNRAEASNPTMRDRLWREWQHTLLTRLSPSGAVILIQTRWHEDDLAGRLISEEPDRWTVVNLPALAEEDDALGREVGETLWPEGGFDSEWAEQRKKEVGSFAWAALYQQRPSPEEGGLFKRSWWRHYTDIPSYLARIVISWDMTFKETVGGSFVVGQVWGAIGPDRYLLDQVRRRMDFVETVNAVQNLSEKWPEATAVYIEDKANGPAVISALKKVVPGIIPDTPKGPKIARWHAVTPLVEAGNIYLPDPNMQPWVHEFIEETANAPAGATDDQLDAMSQALLRLRGNYLSKATRGLAAVGRTQAREAVW